MTAVGEDRPGIVSHLGRSDYAPRRQSRRQPHDCFRWRIRSHRAGYCDAGEDAGVDEGPESLAKEKISVTTRKTKPSDESRFKGYNTYQVSLTGADHEGIVHKISSYLKNHNINIQSMETELVPAPETGTPLFCMNAIVSVPPEISFKKLNEELDALGQEEAVEVDLAAYIESGQEVGV